jgi:hypothetical protein
MKHEPKKHFDISKPRRQGPDPTSKPVIVGHHPMMPDPMIREEREKAAKPIKVTSDGEPLQPLSAEPPHEPAPTESQITPQSIKADEPAKPANLPDLSDISAPQETTPALTPSTKPSPQPEELTAPTTMPEHAPGSIFPPAEKITDTSSNEPKLPETPPSNASSVPQHVAKESIPPTQSEPPVPTEPPAGQELHIPAGKAVVHHKPRVWVWVLMVLVALAWAYAAVDVLSGIKLPYEFFKNVSQ